MQSQSVSTEMLKDLVLIASIDMIPDIKTETIPFLKVKG